jgi:hypothetical protein
MNNQEILNNAPEGATHVDSFDLYWMIKGRDSLCWQGKRKGWLSLSSDTEEFRLLTDIKRIVELETKVAEYQHTEAITNRLLGRIYQGGAL